MASDSLPGLISHARLSSLLSSTSHNASTLTLRLHSLASTVAFSIRPYRASRRITALYDTLSLSSHILLHLSDVYAQEADRPTDKIPSPQALKTGFHIIKGLDGLLERLEKDVDVAEELLQDEKGLKGREYVSYEALKRVAWPFLPGLVDEVGEMVEWVGAECNLMVGVLKGARSVAEDGLEDPAALASVREKIDVRLKVRDVAAQVARRGRVETIKEDGKDKLVVIDETSESRTVVIEEDLAKAEEVEKVQETLVPPKLIGRREAESTPAPTKSAPEQIEVTEVKKAPPMSNDPVLPRPEDGNQANMKDISTKDDERTPLRSLDDDFAFLVLKNRDLDNKLRGIQQTVRKQAELLQYNRDKARHEGAPDPAPDWSQVHDADLRHINERLADKNRPTWMRISKHHITPITLDEHGLPWEEDPSDPGWVIVRAWLPMKFTDMLFDESRRIQDAGVGALLERGMTEEEARRKVFPNNPEAAWDIYNVDDTGSVPGEDGEAIILESREEVIEIRLNDEKIGEEPCDIHGGEEDEGRDMPKPEEVEVAARKIDRDSQHPERTHILPPGDYPFDVISAPEYPGSAEDAFWIQKAMKAQWTIESILAEWTTLSAHHQQLISGKVEHLVKKSTDMRILEDISDNSCK